MFVTLFSIWAVIILIIQANIIVFYKGAKILDGALH